MSKIQNFVRGLVKPGPFARLKFKNNLIYIKRISIINRKNHLQANTFFIKKRKIYFLAGDKKMLRVDSWSSKKKINIKNL